jgi:hypothetical protein
MKTSQWKSLFCKTNNITMLMIEWESGRTCLKYQIIRRDHPGLRIHGLFYLILHIFIILQICWYMSI